MTPAHAAALQYVEAVNARDAARLRALFAPTAVLRHPSGTYEGPARIAEFYATLVFAGQPALTVTRLLSDATLAMVEIAATSPFGAPGQAQYVVDVLAVDDGGRIASLDIYYR
jgi:ketosteroid isomerase-like protein